MVTGQVSEFQERYERAALDHTPIMVWSFRLERQDDRGQPLPRVAVEIRGTAFDGTLASGDWVRIDENWQPGTTLQPRQVTNLSTNSVVHAKGAGPGSNAGKIVALVIFAIFFLSILIWIIVGTASSGP
jgi:hypothetical protein